MSKKIRSNLEKFIGEDKLFTNKDKEQIIEKIERIPKRKGFRHFFDTKLFPGLKYLASVCAFVAMLITGIGLLFEGNNDKTYGDLTTNVIKEIINIEESFSRSFDYFIPIVIYLLILLVTFVIIKKYNRNNKGEMNMKRFIFLTTWTIVIGFVIYMGMKYQLHLQEEAETTFNILPVVRFTTIFPIFIGLLLRVPKLITEIKKEKQWTFDWIKFVAVTLPSLYVVIISFLPYTSFGQGLIPIPEIIIYGSPTITTLAGIIFGYTLLDSLKK